jgi:hypothetical protein
MWPYPNGIKQASQTSETCKALGYKLATVENLNEQNAIWSLISK